MSPVSALLTPALADPAFQPSLGWPDQAELSAQAALTRAMNLIARQQQRIIALESEAQTDSLTGVLNQRGFYKALSREVDRAQRQGKATALLVLFDLDGLKQINDTCGHPAGDAYIKALAKGLSGTRATDYVGRLGGDEFALLLTDAEPAAAFKRVERLLATLNESTVAHAGQQFKLAVSHGHATVTPDTAATTLIAIADKELYRTKAQRKAAHA